MDALENLLHATGDEMRTSARLSVFDKILEQMNAEGEFTSSVLVSEDGWPVAEAPAASAYDGKTVAAMMALGREFVIQTRDHLRLDEVDEVSIVVNDRSRVVCRYFTAKGKPFVLVIMAPPGQSYRRFSTRAIQAIMAAWH